MALVTRSDTRSHGVEPGAADWRRRGRQIGRLHKAELRLDAECRPREAGIRLGEGLLVGTSPASGDTGSHPYVGCAYDA